MNCKEFQHWLTSRDIHEAVLPKGAVDHMAACSSCEQMFHWDSQLENQVATGFQMKELPRGLADQISLSLAHQKRPGPARVRLLAGLFIAGLIGIFTLVFFPFSHDPSPLFMDLNQISRQAVNDHLAGNRHMSFDAAHVDQALEFLTQSLGFKVLLPDFSQYGCLLLGGRLCALGKCKAAYFVLEKDGQSGSLFIMDTQFLRFDMADGSRFDTRIKGCQASVWKDNGQVYAMVF